jgi:pimeloyl-ACP methyl ester carboxylesterase
MRPRLFTLCSFLAALMFIEAIIAPAPAKADSNPGSCQSFYVPVALSSGQPLQYTIYSELCNPASGPSQTVQLLIPGATYGHIYWDFPYEPETYSYVRAANAAGYSTLNIDRIGMGLSSHPQFNITMETNAYVIHEVVQALLAGQIGNQPFARVLLVAHSLGSAMAWIEAGTYHDVAGVIISGLLHHLNWVNLAHVTATLYPADLDPRFAGEDLGPNYLTTEPGTRASDFYTLPGVDPNVLVLDEATKETATTGEAATFALSLTDGISSQIDVPVLVAVGQDDNLLCGLAATDCSSAASVLQAEAPYYCAQAQLQVVVIPGSGHDLNLHESAPLWFASAISWAYQYVAP